MTEQEQLEAYAEDLIQEVISSTEEDDGGDFRVNKFTRHAADILIEAGEIEDVNVCPFKSKGMQLNGYNVHQNEDCLDLFISIHTQERSLRLFQRPK